MTRKDYKLIAEALRDENERLQGAVPMRAIASALADRLKADNPRFDCERFYQAIGV